MTLSAEATYNDALEKHKAQLAMLQRRQQRFGWLRLGLILATGIGTYFLAQSMGLPAIILLIAGIGFFLWVVSLDTDNNKKIKFLKRLIYINKEELSVLQGNIAHRFSGADFVPANHAYAADLDLFGTHSVYQLINRCATEQGRALLAQGLLSPLPVAQIKLRQEASTELAPLVAWRQNFQAHAEAETVTLHTEQKLYHWLAQQETAFTHKSWRWMVPVYALLACTVAALAIFHFISGSLFSVFFLAAILFSFSLGRKATKTAQQLSGIVAEMETLEQLLQTLETNPFKSPLLQSLQQNLYTNGCAASQQIKGLKEILNRFDLRLNIFLFLFLNAFLLWDVRQLMALHAWRKTNKGAVQHWFDAIAQAELQNSLATLHFNKPLWAVPQFEADYFSFSAQAIGHPLLKEDQRVVSDFLLQGKGRMALITGSNMAGKSTFLRSLGVNIVLAQMGAVVCTNNMTLSPVQLVSSMRIADNLAEHTSTFYAELKKLKTIIEAVKERLPVFILLDEILRGTNSLDRHTGSKALIQQLLRHESVAVLATHDVELAKLENQYPAQIANYHFDVQVAGAELYFDYKLKEGVCTNLNASVLMKKIGIELET